MVNTILQNWIFSDFIFPLLLVFLVVFAILEKTSALGKNKQIDALVALVIGLIFVGFSYPKLVVSNMILFLVVALIVMFVGLLLWGFISGGEITGDILSNKIIKWIVRVRISGKNCGKKQG